MSTANAPKRSTDASHDLIGQLVTSGLTKLFDSMKDTVTTNVQENGEQYLQDAVAKLKNSADQVVAWAKRNPVKTALAVAAVAAVSTFLVKSIATNVGEDTASDGAKRPAARTAKRAAAGRK